MTTQPVMSITDEQLAELADGCMDSIQCPISALYELAGRLRAAEADAGQFRKIVSAVAREHPHRSRHRGNAPGHGHDVAGVWDSDNGAIAGAECAWCITWKLATEAMDRTP